VAFILVHGIGLAVSFILVCHMCHCTVKWIYGGHVLQPLFELNSGGHGAHTWACNVGNMHLATGAEGHQHFVDPSDGVMYHICWWALPDACVLYLALAQEKLGWSLVCPRSLDSVTLKTITASKVQHTYGRLNC
jgi:hypothetical protein